MTKVFIARHPTEAHLVKGMLEANGIVAEVRGESLFSARGETPATPDTLPTVWVPDGEDAARALVILAAYEPRTATAGNQDTEWICPACGERIEFQFTECWHCGASRTTPSGAPSSD